MLRNTAGQKIALFALDTATNLGKTGDAANLTAYVSISGGAVTVLGDTSATEMSATNAKGWYLFDLTQGETNGEDLLFTGKSSTSGVEIVGRPVTTTLLTGDSFARIGGLGAGLTALASQSSVDDLPTNSELGTAFGTADDAVLAQVALVKAKTDLIPAAPAAVGDVPTALQNADALLDRNMATGADSGSPTVRTVRQALRILRNRFAIDGGTGVQTIMKEDDATTSWTQVLTGTAGALPVTSTDPAGP